MKKPILLLLIPFFALFSCEKESSLQEDDGISSLNSENVQELSFIINGEKHTVEIDVSSGEPLVSQTEDFFVVDDVFGSNEFTFYVNPAIEDPVLFGSNSEFEDFISKESNVINLKQRFNLKTNASNNISKTSSSTVNPSFSVYKSLNFGGSTFTWNASSGSPNYRNPRLQSNTNLTNGINFNDDISSFEVTNAYLVLYEGAPYRHEKIIVDARGSSFGWRNLQDFKLRTISISNGFVSGSSFCGFICDSFNDEITSIAANGDGTVVNNPGGGGSGGGGGDPGDIPIGGGGQEQ